MRDWRILQLRLDFAARSRQTKITLWWGAVKLQNNSCRGCGLTTLLTALMIHAPQIKIPYPVKSTWIGDFLNEGGQDFGRIGRHEVVRIHQLPPKKIRNLGCGSFFVLSVGRTPFKQKMCRPKGLHNYFRKRSRPYRYHSGNCGILHGACP